MNKFEQYLEAVREAVEMSEGNANKAKKGDIGQVSSGEIKTNSDGYLTYDGKVIKTLSGKSVMSKSAEAKKLMNLCGQGLWKDMYKKVLKNNQGPQFKYSESDEMISEATIPEQTYFHAPSKSRAIDGIESEDYPAMVRALGKLEKVTPEFLKNFGKTKKQIHDEVSNRADGRNIFGMKHDFINYISLKVAFENIEKTVPESFIKAHTSTKERKVM